MYDELHLHCPHCGCITILQSKEGGCTFDIHTMEDAPPAVLADVAERDTHRCDMCDKIYAVRVQVFATIERR